MDFPVITDADSAASYGSALLQGDRVALRASTEDDVATLSEWWQLSNWAVLQQATVKPRSRAAIAEMFTQWSKNETAGSVGLSIENEEGTLIGHTTLWGGELPARVATYAVILGPDFVGRDYGVDVTRVMLRYGFDELGLHKIELQTWSFNTRAVRAYEKAGFIIEGVRRAAVFHAGAFHDQILMGVVEDDYRTTR